MKSIVYVAIAFLYLTSCTSGVRTPNSAPKPRHIVITLHGVRGNAESYGKFHEIIRENLEKLDAAYDVVNYNWTYPVGQAVEVPGGDINGRVGASVWTPHEISKKFNADFFLDQKKKETYLGELGPDDKISIIAYSMGGLMAMSWYYDTMFNFEHVGGGRSLAYKSEDHKKLLSYLAKVKNVIGLGAVYWGSVDAELGWSYLEKGNLAQIANTIPKIKNLCEIPELKQLIEKANAVKGVEFSVRQSVALTCKSVQELVKGQAKLSELDSTFSDAFSRANNSLKDKTGFAFPNIKIPYWDSAAEQAKLAMLNQIKSTMVKIGNVSPHELNHMRLTSDAINEMRKARILHVQSDELNKTYNAKWTSIVGVFPCLGKSDTGLTCSGFSNPDYKNVNEGFKSIFSGLNRRETDGPVISPSAVADFLYYFEAKAEPGQAISADQFRDTKQKQTSNSEIFVENMHATVTPALEGLTGLLQPIGSKIAKNVKEFDAHLGEDVVVIAESCRDPKSCEHPNYKHILQTLGDCETHSSSACDQTFMNQYYKVTDDKDRLTDNKSLKNELGGFVLSMNIYLPATSQVDKMTSDEILKYFKFQFTENFKSEGSFGDHRLNVGEKFAVQVARPGEIMSSYAYVNSYQGAKKILRIYFIGRAWDATNTTQKTAGALVNGVTVDFDIEFPGITKRHVSAKVKPTYSTYMNIHLD